MVSSLGVDFGTNSVRALLVNCANGHELGSAVVNYPSGHQGVLLERGNHHLARQNPADYLACMEAAVRQALEQARQQADFTPETVIGIGVDTTGSSPIPVDAQNRPLAFDPRFQNNLDAQCWLWKDHTSFEEAASITRIAAEHRPQYLAKCGNTYSSEWFWAKIWHCLNVAPEVFDAAYSWVEFCDWIPSVLAGANAPEKVMRGVCSAGHKAMYAEDWGGLPDAEFLAMLSPKLASLRERLYAKAYDARYAAGELCAEWAQKFGLPAGIPIAIGEMDVHYGAIGCGIKEGTLVKVIGTSTCDCLVAKADSPVADIPGICGIVKGSILPGYYGFEAGQSAVGDLFKWWVEVVCQGDAALHAELTQEAAALKPGESGLLALDWNNGNRTILVDQLLSGLILGQTLHTTRAEIYRSLIEATAFGARAIIERLQEYGVRVDRIICAGGIAEKNPMLMQIYADVTGCAMYIAGSGQACALGSAIAASVVAGPKRGGHTSFSEAQVCMSSVKPDHYAPNPENHALYTELYQLYRALHDAFGGLNKAADLSGVMKQLIRIRSRQSK